MKMITYKFVFQIYSSEENFTCQTIGLALDFLILEGLIKHRMEACMTGGEKSIITF